MEEPQESRVSFEMHRLKLVVSNVGPLHFCLIMSLRKWTNYRPATSSVIHCYPPSPHLSPASPLPLFRHTLRLPSPLLPTSALRAIIIMPCINNASQYINNASLQHGGGVEGEGEGGQWRRSEEGGYRRSFPGSAYCITTVLLHLV